MACDPLRRYPLAALLTTRQFDLWMTAAQECTLDTGETVFQEGSAGVWAYLVLEGRVRILRQAVGHEVTLGVAGPGELFGEYALLPPHRNTATCRAAAPVRLLQLPLLPLRPVYKAIPGVWDNLKNWLRLHTTLGHLRGKAFLGFMTGPSALALLDSLHAVTFAPDRTIQADGLSAARWFVVETGTVHLYPPDGSPRELGPGDCFGEHALTGEGGLPTAVAVTETRCRALDRADFVPQTQTQSLQSIPAPLLGVQREWPWVGQREVADCGLAALAMAARLHGLGVEPEYLRRHVEVGANGVSLAALHRAASSLGLKAEGVRVDEDQLSQVDPPFIAHLRDGHYVTVFEQGPGGVTVGDPASGVVRMSHAAFASASSGRLLLIRPLPPAGDPPCRPMSPTA